jgi:DNA-binding response OmpR family regulator
MALQAERPFPHDARREKGMVNRVLVVDDDPATCELIQEVLSSAAIEADAFTDSSQAATRLKENKFDAAFLDMRMPPPDGIELVRQIRASALNQKAVIVMITGMDEREFLTNAFQLGANFVLFKPVDRQALQRSIRVTRGLIDREKHRFTRVNLRCKVTMESARDRLQGTTLDLSANGMLVQANRVFPAGSLVQVSLELNPAKPPVRAAARVARLVGGNYMGLQFENVRLAESERLQEFLAPLILANSSKAPALQPVGTLL